MRLPLGRKSDLPPPEERRGAWITSGGFSAGYSVGSPSSNHIAIGVWVDDNVRLGWATCLMIIIQNCLDAARRRRMASRGGPGTMSRCQAGPVRRRDLVRTGTSASQSQHDPVSHDTCSCCGCCCPGARGGPAQARTVGWSRGGREGGRGESLVVGEGGRGPRELRTPWRRRSGRTFEF